MELLTGAGHPSKRLKGELGQHYKDTVTGDVWECISSNEHSRIHHQLMGGYIWKKMATGNHIEACNAAGSAPTGPTEVVILPETVVTVNEKEGIITTPLSAKPTGGATAKVTYNGTEYLCSFVAEVDEAGAGYMLGNLDIIGRGGGNPDAPFVASLLPDGIDDTGDGTIAYGFIMPLDGATTVTLSIVQIGAASGGESTGVSSSGFDFIIAQNGEGNYTWAKGDHVSFIDRLIDGPPPLVCIYDTNGDHESPTVLVHVPVLIELNSGSGTHCYIRYADERELYVDVNTGDIS